MSGTNTMKKHPLLARDIVAGMSIALVGNSAAILREKPGRQIDSRDVVIRINRGIPQVVDPDAIGHRTSIWATAKHWNDLEAPKGCHVAMWMKLTALGRVQLPFFRHAHEKHLVVEEWSQTDEDLCREFVGADPGTGIRMLWWLRHRADPRSVSCYGMDCWEEPTHWSGRKQTANHRPDLERQAMLRLL